jgi:hypothetical protein
MALYRFLDNPRVTPRMLAEPLRAALASHLGARPAAYTLLVHDQSVLSYHRHKAKADRLRRTHKSDVGYELLTSLAVDTRDGDPIAPTAMRLRAARAVHSTSESEPRRSTLQDLILPRMNDARAEFPGTTFVHVADREFDSIGHHRGWHAAGHLFLVRAKGNRRVLWEGRSIRLDQIPPEIAARDGAFRLVGEVRSRGRAGGLWVAGTEVTRDRPARPHTRGRKGRSRAVVKGAALTIRLVIAQIRFGDGSVEVWLLYSNVPRDVDDETLARWYYWRWRIESFFKLLKSSGMAVESWKQRNGLAILRRLLLAAMALSLVYRLSQAPGGQAAANRRTLIRLSGRLMGHEVEHTVPALLAGMYALLQIRHALETYTRAEIEALHDAVFGRIPP